MMQRHPVLAVAALLLLAPSCRHARPPVASGAASACPPTTPYVLLDGVDTIGVSETMVTDSTFTSRDRAVAQRALLRFVGRRDPSGAVTRLTVRIWHDVADSLDAPTQQADVEFGAAEAVSRVASPARGVQLQRDAVRPGMLPYMANIPLFLELVQRRGSGAIEDSVPVPVLWLFTGGETDEFQVVRPTADSVVVRFPGIEYRLRRTSDGAIAGGIARSRTDGAASDVRIVRPGCTR